MTDALEVRLMSWSETSRGGRTVTFLLPEDGSEHPFKGLRTGKKDGDKFAIAVVRIDDPEAKADHIFGPEGYTKGSEPTPGQRAVKRAGILCKDKDFGVWMITKANAWNEWRQDPDYPQNAESFVRSLICEECGITSRRDLAVDPAAVEKFEALETSFRYREAIR